MGLVQASVGVVRCVWVGDHAILRRRTPRQLKLGNNTAPSTGTADLQGVDATGSMPPMPDALVVATPSPLGEDLKHVSTLTRIDRV